MNLMFAANVSAFENLNYKSKSTAVFEIATMLIGSFLLGYILHWLICRALHSDVGAPAPVVRPVVARRSSTPDDLKVVEGIGPKIEELLNAAGIMTFADLADASAAKVKAILDKAGPRYQMHDPSTWGRQAALARDGRLDDLEALKDRLTSGRS
jgi:hypothetical protein